MTKIASITLLTVLLGCSSKPETHPPDSAQNENLYQQAQQALKARRLVEAAQTLEILFDSDTLHYEAAHSLGEIYLRQKRYQQALRPLERAQRLQPARIEARMQLAQALARLGREAEARALFTLLVDAFPGNVTACMAYADLLMTQDQPDAAGALAQQSSNAK